MRRIYAMLLSVCMLMCLASCDGTATEVNIDNNINNNIDSNIENGVNNENQQGDSDVDIDFNESHNHGDSSTKENIPNVIEPTKKQETPTKQPTQPAATSPSHIHNYSNATCTQPKTCSCGATTGSALGHQFSSATCTSAKKCSRCGATSGSALGHNYVNGKCSRCGKVDPDSLPVGLHELYIMDSYCYKYLNTLTDSFGNNYGGAHAFNHTYESHNGREPHSTFSLNQKYTRFRGSIVATSAPEEEYTYYVKIYVDDVLKYSKTGYSKMTGKIDFDINVENGGILKIAVGAEQNSGGVKYDIAIVNAKLEK